MDEQIIPGGGGVLPAPVGSARSAAKAAKPGKVAHALLKKAPSVTFGLSGLDQAVPAPPLVPETAQSRTARLGGAAHGPRISSTGSTAPAPQMFMPMAHLQQLPPHLHNVMPFMSMPHHFMPMPMGVGFGMPHAATSAAAAAAVAAAAAAAVVKQPKARQPKVPPMAASTMAAASAAASAAAVAAAVTNITGASKSVSAPKEAATASMGCDASPDCAPPPAQKPRWETPLRIGTWPESWQSATALAGDAPTSVAEHVPVSRTVRATLAEVIISYVGEQLPKATVEKWLCLLSEYLELSADEQILVVCLLRRYVDCGGVFVGDGDHMRPQTWERVVAIACYLAVLLSEEFPGRAASDLRELLGPNFRFGQEQIAFLKTVNWRISVNHSFFQETKASVIAKDRVTLIKWFKTAQAASQRNARAAKAAAEAKATIAALSAKATVAAKPDPLVAHSKKRTAAQMSAASIPEDGVVPGATGATGSADDLFSGAWAAPQWGF